MREKKSRERGLVGLAVMLLVVAGAGVPSGAQPPARPTAPPKVRRSAPPKPRPSAAEADQKAMLGTISADSLRGHLRFLASDLLEGRDTPSRGLDLAAEYIASQMMRAGVAGAHRAAGGPTDGYQPAGPKSRGPGGGGLPRSHAGRAGPRGAGRSL